MLVWWWCMQTEKKISYEPRKLNVAKTSQQISSKGSSYEVTYITTCKREPPRAAEADNLPPSSAAVAGASSAQV
jgi:hypothetical protein